MKIVGIILDAILLIGVILNLILGVGDWNDYLIIFGLVLVVPGHILVRIKKRKGTDE